MTTIEIQCPDEILISLKEDAATFSRDLRLTAAVKFYEMGRLSSGRAAEFAGLPRLVFLRRLADFGVPIIDESRDELAEDLKNA